MKIKINTKKAILWGSVLIIIDMIIGNTLYMNPIVAGINKNIENIAYCGLYCDECPNRKGIIADMARDLRKELRVYRFNKTAELLSSYSFFKIFEKFAKELFFLQTH